MVSVVTRPRSFRRRLLGLLVFLGFGLASAEPLIADECDGDFALVSICAVPSSGQAPGSGGSAPSPGHTLHVCHCVHVHGGMPVPTERVAAALSDIFDLAGAIPLPPPGPALDRALRPPIA